MKQERKQYYIVDAVKFIMCIFIIALHCRVHMMFTMSYWIEKKFVFGWQCLSFLSHQVFY